MRTLLIIFFTVLFQVAKGQIDSTWVVENYFPRFYQDTGIYLPSIKLIDEKGKTRKLSEFKGKVLYINIWSTSCGSSIGEFPHLEQLFKRCEAISLDSSIQFINICSDASQADWKKHLKLHHPVGINLFSYDTIIEKAWRIKAPPEYLLLGRDGKIMAKEVPMPEEGFIDYILYAATKGVLPAKSIWTEFGQNEHYRKYGKFTDNKEGADYSIWHYSTVELRVAYFKWKQQQEKERK